MGPAIPILSVGTSAAVALSLLAGCTVGPDYQAPAAPHVPRLTETPLPARMGAAGASQILVDGRDIPGDWWTMFHSPEITSLVSRALTANPDLAAAQATLLEARQNRRAEQGALFPTVTANGTAERERTSLSAVGFGSGSETYDFYSLGLNVSYTLDTFGGVRRQVEELGATAEYQRFQLEGSYLTLAANVASAAITEASLRAQIATVEDIVRTESAGLDILQKRFTLGGVSQVDVLQQRATRDQEAALLPGLRKQLEQERNQLAVYLGTQPGNYAEPALNLDELTLPDELPVSLPSKLVAQRPDIQAYGALLHQATAQVGVATANMLPSLSLTATYGREGALTSQLFTPAGLVASIAASIAQPVFEGGTLLARKRAAVAAMQVAAAQYSSTVNTAFQNVANALVALKRDAETLQADQTAEATAAASLAVARGQYAAGGGTYLNVLTAEQTEQNARLNVVTARGNRFTDSVALFQALGGGWWNRDDVDPLVAKCCGVLP